MVKDDSKSDRKGWWQLMSKVFDIAFRLGGELTSSFKNTFKDASSTMAALGTAAIAIGGAAGFAELAGQVSEVSESLSKLQAQTGVTGEQFEALKDTATNIFRDNYGESFEEVTDALARVKQNMHNLDQGELESVTKNALMLSNTFDAEVNEVTRAANNMMTAFGVESTKAFDLFAAGAQRGLNFSDEMFDNIAEYSPLFGAMGYSAEEYFGIMERGAKAGVYNLDYVNDVMKEFQIRVKDGSKATNEAMSEMSKDTQNVWKEFLKGNGTVSDVASTVVGELQNMENQVEAGQLAVSLFGTKWEDLESSAMYAMLGTNEAMQDFEGRMEAINKIRFDTPGKAIRGIGRILFTDLVLPIGDAVLPILNVVANMLSNNLPGAIAATKNILQTLAPVIFGVGAAFVTYQVLVFSIAKAQLVFNAVQKASVALLYAHRTAMYAYMFAGGGVRGVIVALRSAMAALNLTMLANPFVLTAAAIAGVGVAFYTAYKMSDRFRAAVDSVFAAMRDFVINTSNFIASNVVNIWNGLIDSTVGLGARITDSIGNGMTGNIGKIVSSFVDSFKTGLSSLPGIISMVAPMLTTVGLGFLGVTGPVGIVIGAIVSLIGFIYRLSKTNESVAGVITSAWQALGTAFAPIFDVLADGFDQFASEVGPQLTQTMDVISSSVLGLAPAFAQLGGTLAQLGALLLTQWVETVITIASVALPILLQVFQTVFPILITVISSIIPIIMQLVQTIIPLILSVVQMVFPVVLGIIQSVLPVIATLLMTVAGIIMQLVQTLIPLILSVVQMVFPVVLGIIQSVIPIIAAILQVLVTVINMVLIPAIQAILAIVQFVFQYVQMVIQNALAIVNGLIQAAMALLKGDWDGAWQAILTTAQTIMNNIISFFQGINLFEVGRAIVNGLIDGIKSMGSAVIGAVSGMIPEPIKGAASKLLGALPGFAEGGVVSAPTLAWIGEGGDTETVIPWNSSQRSKDLWLQTGRAIGMFGDDAYKLDPSLNDLGDDVNSPFNIQPAAIQKSAGGGDVVIHVSNEPTIIIQGDADPGEVEKEVKDASKDVIQQLEERLKDKKRAEFE